MSSIDSAKTFKDDNCHPYGCYFCQKIEKRGCEYPVCTGFISSGEFEIIRFQHDLDLKKWDSEYNAVALADLDPDCLDVIRVLLYADDLPFDFDEVTREMFVECLNSFKELISKGKILLRRPENE